MSSATHWTRGGAAAVLLAAAVLYPVVVTSVAWQDIGVLALINACGALGMTLLFGYAGQISLAQAAFMGVGGFAPAVLFVKVGISPWWGLFVGVGIAMLIAVVFGGPVLRLEGLYLAMATTALGLLMIIVSSQLRSVTGGPFGLAGLAPLRLFGHDLFSAKDFYYPVLVAFTVLLLLAYRLVTSPIGTMLAAISHDSRAASLTGIPVWQIKVKIFAIAAGFSAVGGFFFTERLLVASPDSFGVIPSLYVLLMVVVGGTRSLLGALVGAFFVTAVPQLIPGRPSLQQILFASSFLIIAVYWPDGIMGIVRSLARQVQQRLRNTKPDSRLPVAGS